MFLKCIVLYFLSGFFAILNASPISHSEDSCPEESYSWQTTHVQRTYFPKDKTCYILINPVFNNDLKYRSFLWSTEGLFMIFDSLGAGPDDKMTAARVFYQFPRSVPHLQMQTTEDRLWVKNRSGIEFIFQKEDPGFVNIQPGQVVYKPEIRPEMRGGIEFTQVPGVLLDAGYARGRSPVENSNGFSVFIDSQQNKCRVQNKYIFNYLQNDVRFKWTDLELLEFLKQKCSNLKLWQQ